MKHLRKSFFALTLLCALSTHTLAGDMHTGVAATATSSSSQTIANYPITEFALNILGSIVSMF